MKTKITTLLMLVIFFFISATAFANTGMGIEDDDKKKAKNKHAIKADVSALEKSPLQKSDVSTENDQAYNYMSSPKLEDCTKSDFDRE